jgi:lipopolysaccharide export system permease protein
VFFIEKNSANKQTGNNVFIATKEQNKETITSARSGHIEIIGSDKFLVLENGQRLEKNTGKSELTVSVFETYGARVGADDVSGRSYVPSSSLTSMELLKAPNLKNLAELSWRLGLALAAFNFIVIAVAVAGTNPRVGRSANLGFAFLIFVVYFNFLVLGKSWVESGQVQFVPFLLTLHGGALVLGFLWLIKRHFNWSPRWRARPTLVRDTQGSTP